MNSALVDRARSIVATTFNLPIDQVTPTSSMETIEAWDSMGHLALVLEVEQEFGISLSPEDIEKMSHVQHIADIVQQKQN